MALPAIAGPIIGGVGGLLGGLFGGGGGLSDEQKELLEQALRIQREQYRQTAPLRDLGIEQLQEPIAARPDLSAGFFDPGNPYNRIPMPATLAGGSTAGMPGAQNPVLSAVGAQLGALGLGPSADTGRPAIPPPSDRGGMGVTNPPMILPARASVGGRGVPATLTQRRLPRLERPEFVLPARR